MMGTRRTPIKRKRVSQAGKLGAWSAWFECGVAFDGDLLDLGLFEASADDFDRAARDAWRRLGGAFMATWQPTASVKVPYALETYGGPDGNETHAT